jgi:hypothetical protein
MDFGRRRRGLSFFDVHADPCAFFLVSVLARRRTSFDLRPEKHSPPVDDVSSFSHV